jgi:hypothetical protein
VQNSGIPICLLRRKQIVEEPQGVEHGSLDVCNQWRAGKLIDVPKREASFRKDLVTDEFLERVKIEGEITSRQGLLSQDDFMEKTENRKSEETAS